MYMYYSVIDAAANPMSIIIVGVGAADFAQMEKLDGDDVKLELKGKKAPVCDTIS